MSATLLGAALLAASLAAAHSVLGERHILIRLLRRDDLPRLFGGTEFTRRTLRFAWHLSSVAWFGFAVLLVALAAADGVTVSTLLRIVSITFAASGVLALVGSRGRHLSWIVFLAIAALSWLGSR